MSESVELNKKLTDTHIPTSIQLSQCPCLCCSCVDGQTIWNHTLSQKHIKVWELLLYKITCQVHRMCLQSPRNRRVSIAVGESRLLDFIGMRAVLEGFPSWAQSSGSSSSRQTVNLQAAQWPAFKFSPRSPVTPLGHTLSKLKHTAHTPNLYEQSCTHTLKIGGSLVPHLMLHSQDGDSRGWEVFIILSEPVMFLWCMSLPYLSLRHTIFEGLVNSPVKYATKTLFFFFKKDWSCCHSGGLRCGLLPSYEIMRWNRGGGFLQHYAMQVIHPIIFHNFAVLIWSKFLRMCLQYRYINYEMSHNKFAVS